MEWRVTREDVVLGGLEGLCNPLDVVDRVSVGEHDPLGLSGGARGVEDVGEIRVDAGDGQGFPRTAGLGSERLDVCAERGLLACLGVGQQHHSRWVPPWPRRHERLQVPRGRDERADAAVLQDERGARCRRFRVDRHVDSSSLVDARHRNDRFDGLREVQPDAVAGLHTVRHQQRREAIGLGVELAVRHGPIAIAYRDPIGEVAGALDEIVLKQVAHGSLRAPCSGR